MSKPFSTLPHSPTIPLTPFQISIPQSSLDSLQRDLAHVPSFRQTYENSHTDEPLGVTLPWLQNALAEWKTFDWRAVEREMNSYPQWKAKLEHLGEKFDVHFIGLFSEKKDAIPVIMPHGWPGSVFEFRPLYTYLTKTYTPATLPVHMIFPSLIGYGFSSPPPLTQDFQTCDNAPLFDKLMTGLGFEAYAAQGGDIGSYITRFLGMRAAACKAVHVTMCKAPQPEGADPVAGLDELDRELVDRYDYFTKWEFAYSHEHSTKTSTIGLVVSSSPAALLAWIGEKMLVWSDTSPSLDLILANISLYYHTSTFQTCLYHYRSSTGPHAKEENQPKRINDKPFGYSVFAKEILPAPISWVEKCQTLAWSRRHKAGGHFAAMECPEVLFGDVLDFLGQVWKW